MLSALKGTHLKGQAQKCNTMTYETRCKSSVKGCLNVIHSSSSTPNVPEVIFTSVLGQNPRQAPKLSLPFPIIHRGKPIMG